MLRHRVLVTAALVGVLLLNLTVVGRLTPASAADTHDLPPVAHCQGGGAGCTEQPLIPPPAVGLPRFELPPAPVFGEPSLIEAAAPSAVPEPPVHSIERPPVLALA
jgi:hypothetical protein